MRDPNDNVIVVKSKKFAVRCINLCRYLTEKHREFRVSQQLIRSGTSIGANVKEAIRGQSRADFAAKMNIALKEASETEFWLELLRDTHYLNELEFNSINADCSELLRLLTSIVKTTYANR